MRYINLCFTHLLTYFRFCVCQGDSRSEVQ